MSILSFYDAPEQALNKGITYMYPQAYGGFFPHPYTELRYPEMYLDFCMEDIKQNDIRGRTNAFSNCKKSIHIRVDLILNQYGLLAQNMKCDFPTKLEMIQAVGLLPTLMLKNINDERNLIEHDYRIPEEKRVREAIDVAELLYMASEDLMQSTPIEVIVGFDIEPIHRLMRLEPLKGQLVFYSIDRCEKYCYGLFDEYNIQYIKSEYREMDGSISDDIQVSPDIHSIIELNYTNMNDWKYIITQLHHLSTDRRRMSSAGKIIGGATIMHSSIVKIPMNVPKDMFMETIMRIKQESSAKEKEDYIQTSDNGIV